MSDIEPAGGDSQAAPSPPSRRRRGAPAGNRNAAKDGDPGFNISVYVSMDEHRAIRLSLERRLARKPSLTECKEEARSICKVALEQLLDKEAEG